MCGIAGIIDYAGAQPIDASLPLRMRDALAHRGPDGDGIYVADDGHAALAHTRLAIIDLSAAGAQPMASANGRYRIVFNGEIYNYRELRAELLKQGVTFRSATDTEVILTLYEREGPRMVHRLRGMFALAIWDSLERKLWAVRDRLGVKPLYYAVRNGRFYFASEIKAILAVPDFPRQTDPTALYHFLTFLTSHGPQTLFAGIQKLAAGHELTLSAHGDVHLSEYWDVFDSVPSERSTAPAEELLARLTESIRYRMVSDVPVGVFLSGGIDSTANVALMARMSESKVRTFTIGFDGPDKYNELTFARLAARHFGTDHSECRIGVGDLLSFLPDLVHHQDEPIADPVCVPVYYVARLAKGCGVTVCHVGEGADELFCGYPYWQLMLKAMERSRWIQAVPSAVRQVLPAALRSLGQTTSHRYEVMRRAAAGEHLFWGGAEGFSEEHKQRVLTSEFLQTVQGVTSHDVVQHHFARYTERAPRPDALGWMSYLDLRLRLPELLLMRVDKMTMATAVEARVPFLDPQVVGFALGLTQEEKIPGGELKALLKQAVGSLLPREILERPKQGFGVPVTEWLLEELGTLASDAIDRFTRTVPYLRRDAMAQLGPAMTPARTWYLLNLALWHRAWIEGEPIADILPLGHSKTTAACR